MNIYLYGYVVPMNHHNECCTCWHQHMQKQFTGWIPNKSKACCTGSQAAPITKPHNQSEVL